MIGQSPLSRLLEEHIPDVLANIVIEFKPCVPSLIIIGACGGDIVAVDPSAMLGQKEESKLYPACKWTIPASTWTNVECVCLDGKKLYASSGNLIQVWDVDSKELQMSLRGHARRVLCLCLVAGGTRLMSGGEDHTLRIWDTSTGACVKMFTFRGPVKSLDLSPNGRMVCLSFAKVNYPFVMDVQTFQTVVTLYMSGWNNHCWSNDGQLIYVALDSGKIESFQVDTSANIPAVRFETPRTPIRQLVTVPGSDYLIGHRDTRSIIEVWNVRTGRIVGSLVGRVSYREDFGPSEMIVCNSRVFLLSNNRIETWSWDDGFWAWRAMKIDHATYSACAAL